ncbi:MAG: sigma 54-interacting transcriptional regulator [Desulfobacterales bacterium]|nr:sigma 54-interacting transcriptional regulator [Desulfobacterales bacterium]
MTAFPEKLFDNAIVGILCVDDTSAVTYMNLQATHLLPNTFKPGCLLTDTDPELSKAVNHVVALNLPCDSFHMSSENDDIVLTISPSQNAEGNAAAICLVQSQAAVENAAWHYPNVKEIQRQFQAIVDHSYYGIYIMDGDGIVLRVNDVAAGLIGMKKSDMLGMDIRNLARDGIVDQALTPTILRDKKPVSRPLYVFGQDKYIMASGIPILDKDGNVLFVVVIEHDMTMVKDLRDQLHRAREITEKIKSELSDRNLLEMKDSCIIAESPAMHQVLNVLVKLAKMDASNILITGESGTGKGFLSKFVHQNSPRKDKPFISINCAALPEMLLEAELFGYEKGAFTGAADTGKAGLFELANGGTIFLDEIGDLPFSVQAKLLKCLDDGEIRRLGGTKAIKVDCTVLAATNLDLEELVNQKKFRQDLYFRLNIFPVKIPPLRERQEDIIRISDYYLKKYNKTYNQNKQFSEKCLEQLLTYSFPGNVRELKNIIKNAVVIKEKKVLNNILPANTLKTPATITKKAARPRPMDLNEELLAFEKKKLKQALDKVDSTRELSEYLGVSQSTIVRKLKKHGLSMDS